VRVSVFFLSFLSRDESESGEAWPNYEFRA
jgi:hypothetical protein